MWEAPKPFVSCSYDYLLKVIVVGDSSVGKSCLLLRFVDKRFRDNHELTIGVEFGCRVVQAAGLRFKVHVWDTAGQEAFRSITRAYYRSAAVALLVFDVTRRRTFENLERWAADVLAAAVQGVELVVVANKTDLECQREVSREEAEAFALRHGAAYYETSARDASNVDEAFLAPCVAAIEKNKTAVTPVVYRVTPTPPESRATRCCQAA
jgi:Ras-related protein Rab-2A